MAVVVMVAVAVAVVAVVVVVVVVVAGGRGGCGGGGVRLLVGSAPCSDSRCSSRSATASFGRPAQGWRQTCACSMQQTRTANSFAISRTVNSASSGGVHTFHSRSQCRQAEAVFDVVRDVRLV